MKEQTKYIIENLTQDSVTIHTLYYVVFNEQEIQTRDIHTCTYTNDEKQRKMLISEVPTSYVNAILSVWEDNINLK